MSMVTSLVHCIKLQRIMLQVAALLHRAAYKDVMPTIKESKSLLPKPALSSHGMPCTLQWVRMVQRKWTTDQISLLSTYRAKAKVLEILSGWPLFGSSFFAVRLLCDILII